MFTNRKNFPSGYYGDGNYNESRLKPTKKKKPKSEFRKYFSNLMQQSLITGFPEIAESKNIVRRTAKALVFLVCSVGFLYQTWSFLDMYLEFPTILDIRILHPEKIEAPAITICNRNRLWRQRYCEAFRDHCVFNTENADDFCETFSVYCPSDERQHNFTIVIPGYVIEQNRSNEVLAAVGPQNEGDIIEACLITGGGNIRDCDSASRIQAPIKGYPTRCFSFFSLLGKPDVNPESWSLTEEIDIAILLHPEEYMNPDDMIQAYVSIHDPRRITNPTADGVTLKAGIHYRLYATMQKRESLPLPYESNCTDYLATWRENGGYGPITKRGCTDWCKIQVMIKEYGCVSQNINYPNNFTICEDNLLDNSDEVNEICSASCNDACNSSHYTITTEVLDDAGLQSCEKTDLHCRNQILPLTVSFSRMEIQKYKLQPKFESVELFSYIGGYMGMWLGISLVSLFDFVETLGDILAYPVIKLKKSKKKVNQVERMQRNIPYSMYDI